MMKRILHYLLLAAVLLGTPLLCCLLGGYDAVLEGVKQFPPRTEDWGFRPELLWNVRRPFNWWAFGGMCLFTYFCMAPLVRRGLKAVMRPAERRAAAGRRFPAWGWGGIVFTAVFWVISWNR